MVIKREMGRRKEGRKETEGRRKVVVKREMGSRKEGRREGGKKREGG